MCVFQAALGALLYVRANAASVDSNAAPQGSDAPNLNSWWARVLLAGTAYFGSIAGSHQVSFKEMDQLAGKIETAASSQQLILDMDLVRGSSMRIRSAANARTLNTTAVLRVFFMPLYLRWWASLLGFTQAAALALVWTSHLLLLLLHPAGLSRFGTIVLRIHGDHHACDAGSFSCIQAHETTLSDNEIWCPVVVLLCLALTYGQYGGEKRTRGLPKVITSLAGATSRSPRSPTNQAETTAVSAVVDETDTSDESDQDDSSEDSDEEDQEVQRSHRASASKETGKVESGQNTQQNDDNGDGSSLSGSRVTHESVARVKPAMKSFSKSGRLGADCAEGKEHQHLRVTQRLQPVARESPAPWLRQQRSSSSTVRMTTWQFKGAESHLREMPFLVGGASMVKPMMTLQDVGRVISARAVEKAINSRYLSAAAIFACVLACTPPLQRLQPELTALLDEGIAAAKKAPPGSGGLQVARVTLLAGWAQLVAADRGLVCGTIVCICSKFVWSFLLLFQLAVVERSESARCLKAKYFGALTSRGKSRRWGLPHFRLHKLPNIRLWLALRSHLRRLGPSAVCSMIVGRCCGATLLFTLVVSVRFLNSEQGNEHLNGHGTHNTTDYNFLRQGPEGSINLELLLWNVCLGFFSLRYIQISLYLNSKYKQNIALLYSEQMHCHIRMQYKPHKRHELLCCIQVLKVGSKLLKELEGPYKISGLPMSPLYNSLFKLIVLSALSAVASQVLGLNLRLWKISL